LDDWEAHKSELEALNVRVVVAGSVDSAWHAQEIADGVSFPIAQGVSREQGEAVGAFWEDDRKFIQPAEFILAKDGTVRGSSYSAGRLDAADAIKLVTFWESKK
jgi:peroxiredoxin